MFASRRLFAIFALCTSGCSNDPTAPEPFESWADGTVTQWYGANQPAEVIVSKGVCVSTPGGMHEAVFFTENWEETLRVTFDSLLDETGPNGEFIYDARVLFSLPDRAEVWDEIVLFDPPETGNVSGAIIATAYGLNGEMQSDIVFNLQVMPAE